MVWHGGLAALLSVVVISNPETDPAAGAVQTRVFDIEYRVNESALPLDAVHLWYTADKGTTWHHFGLDEDRLSPMTFDAPSEGLFGFYFVATNATGSSTAPPTATTKPHAWAFVDYTPPVAQVHPLRQTTLMGQRVVQIRWTAIDAHLVARPITIEYSRPPQEEWFPVTTDPIANTGRYDWRPPDDQTGAVAVRITVRDKGGHVVVSEPQHLELTRPASENAAGAGQSRPAAGAGNEAAVARARRLFEQGLKYRDQGDERRAIAELRDAVRLDPGLTEAFAAMADLLYRMGDVDRAKRAYEIVISQEPGHRNALRGLAAISRQRNDYASAAARLREILRNSPDDAEVWMNLGDVAVFQGDEITARHAYIKATEVDPGAVSVIADARKRLELMTETSKNRD